MTTITIEELYERCEVLVDVDDNMSHYVQFYDDPVIEADDGSIVKELHDDEPVIILENGNVMIESIEYIPYRYVQVTKDELLDV